MINWRSCLTNAYPFFLAAVPVLCSYAIRAASSQPPTVMLFPLLFSEAICALLLAGLWLACRNLEKAAMLAAVIFLALFAPLYLALVGSLAGLAGLNPSFLASPQLLLLLAALLAGGGVLAACFGQAKKLSTWLRNFAFYFLLMQLLAIGIAIFFFLQNLQKISLSVTESGGAPKAAQGDRPDFFYIILDGYANPQTLRERFAYDNSGFRKKLSDMGFTVIEDSFSNYAITELSLCSSLNMGYLDPAAKVLGKESDDLSALCWFLQDNQILRVLRSRGYGYVNLGGSFGPTAWNFFATKNVPAGLFDMFAIDCWQTSTLGLVESLLKERLVVGYYRGSLRSLMGNIEKAATLPGPKFVFAHVLLPHPPFVFTDRGTDSGVRALSFAWPEEGRQAYLEQVKYTESAITSVLQALSEKCGNNAVIVVQSDHGPGFEPMPGEDEKLFRFHRLRIFNAFKLPKGVSLPARLSPVNTFRLLFNQTLGCSFAPLEDRAFLSTYEKPYRYLDITELYAKPLKP